MKTKIDNLEQIAEVYKSGKSLDYICAAYHIGKLRAKEIIKSCGAKIRQPSCGSTSLGFIVSDWRIKKYINTENYYYVAISKIDGTEFCDMENKGGHLTGYIEKKLGIKIPSLYDRRVYYQTTGNYWWEQWFNVEKRDRKKTKKCPYCGWETIDIENKSGMFEQHLLNAHSINIEQYLEEYPEDISYFSRYEKVAKRIKDFKDNTNFTVCPICGEKYKRITSSHLLQHGITMNEFKDKYPYVKILSEKQHVESQNTIKEAGLHISKNKFISKYEKEIQKFLTANNVEFQSNRQLLIGKEIDLLIEDKKIGIEFDGLKWHTEWFGGKTHHYHLDKTIECNKKGYGLIHIFEDEYVNHREIVYSKLSHILGLNYNLPKIMARKCIIKNIYMSDAKEFLEKYHIQGFSSSTVYLGCFYENNLVAVMCFKNGNIRNPYWELTRFATNYNYRFQGVGSKMFKYFITNYNPDKIISFADRRWTISPSKNLYTSLGFDLDNFTRPDYRYYKNESKNGMKYQRIHKMSFNKKKLSKDYGFPLTMTETEMAKELGYDRIWDCGLIKYVWKNEKAEG